MDQAQPTLEELNSSSKTKVHLEVEVPDRLSDWLQLALDDAAKSAAEGIELDMGSWLAPYYSGCAVCLAGAVMLQRLPAYLREPAKRGELSLAPIQCNGRERIAQQLEAIDSLRRGHLVGAIRGFYGFDSAEDRRWMAELQKQSQSRSLPRWYGWPLRFYNATFVEAMGERIAWLREHGL